MQTEPQPAPRTVRLHWCRHGRPDRDRFVHEEPGPDGKLGRVLTELLCSWAQPGCGLCSGSGMLRLRGQEPRPCTCAWKRFRRAHPDVDL